MTQTLWDAKECLHGRCRIDDDGECCREICEICGALLHLWSKAAMQKWIALAQKQEQRWRETPPAAPKETFSTVEFFAVVV